MQMLSMYSNNQLDIHIPPCSENDERSKLGVISRGLEVCISQYNSNFDIWYKQVVKNASPFKNQVQYYYMQ